MTHLDDFVVKYGLLGRGVSVISALGLRELKQRGCSAEDFLNYLVEKHNCLLHGSRKYIPEDFIKTNSKNEVYATDSGGIAILRAIISNKGLAYPGLEYPYFISDKEPLEVRIHGIKDDTIGEKGLVYIIPNREGFKNQPEGSWQYISSSNACFSAIIEVLKEDFKYPVFDVDKNKQIQ